MRKKALAMQNAKIRPKPPVDPIVKSMYSIDGEMSNILNRDDIPLDQKMTLYDQTLQKYMSRYQQYKHESTKPILVNTVNSTITTDRPKDTTDKPKDIIQDLILQSIPKAAQSKTEMLMERLKEVVSWNDRGEFGYKGQPVIRGSNLIDLVGNAARHRTLKNVNPEGMNTFLTALRDVNVPQSWISNKSYLEEMHKIASTPLQNIQETPVRQRRLPTRMETPAVRQMTENLATKSLGWDDDDEEESGYNTRDSFLTPNLETPSTLAESLKNWTTFKDN